MIDKDCIDINTYRIDQLKKRVYDLETTILQIRELCGNKTRELPLEIHVIIELCEDILKKRV